MNRITLNLFSLTFIFLSFGCEINEGNQSVKFTVKNLSEKKIASCKFYGSYGINAISFSDSVEFNRLIEPCDSATFSWENPKLYKSDGAFYIKANNLEYQFGYFSNGVILDGLSEYTLKVYNDSIR